MDKLIKLTKKSVPALMELYKGASYPKNAVTYSAFKNFLIQSEKHPELANSLEIYSLNDEWNKDGLFLMRNGSGYYFDCLEPQPFERLRKVLNLIDYRDEVVFRAVRDQFKPVINDLLWLKNLEISDQTGTSVYFLPTKFVAKLKQPPIPDGWVFRSLTMDDVEEINQKLLREGGDNVDYVTNSIKYKITLGLFDENNKLQGWLFGVDVGTQGTLGVTDGQQQKGAASALGVKFGQMVLNEYGMDTVWHVAHGNDKSHNMAAKFSGRLIDTVTWMSVRKRTSKKMTKMGMFQIFYPNKL